MVVQLEPRPFRCADDRPRRWWQAMSRALECVSNPVGVSKVQPRPFRWLSPTIRHYHGPFESIPNSLSQAVIRKKVQLIVSWVALIPAWWEWEPAVVPKWLVVLPVVTISLLSSLLQWWRITSRGPGNTRAMSKVQRNSLQKLCQITLGKWNSKV